MSDANIAARAALAHLDRDHLAHVHLAAADALGELAKLFKPGMRLTFVARHPDHAERHVIVSDDSTQGLADLMAKKVTEERGPWWNQATAVEGGCPL
ncbi:hypothetical protein [Gemmata sp.]|uniref:hypothetical protein n=1 Tax=Gemmata sp. TaxID=1914242 RepID=UPI003F70ECE5